MNIIKVLLCSIIAAICILICCNVALGAPGAMTEPESDASTSDVPIDGGVSLLVAAGVGYGVKKLYHKKKQ